MHYLEFWQHTSKRRPDVLDGKAWLCDSGSCRLPILSQVAGLLSGREAELP